MTQFLGQQLYNQIFRLGLRLKKKKMFSKCGNNLCGWLSRNWTANIRSVGFNAYFAATNQ